MGDEEIWVGGLGGEQLRVEAVGGREVTGFCEDLGQHTGDGEIFWIRRL